MSSKKDSYDKPSRKVTRVLGQTDHGHRNNETSIRLDQPGPPSGQIGCTSNSPQWRVRPKKQSNSPNGQVGSNEQSNSPARRVGPNEQSNSPIRRVGSTSMPSSRPRSFLLRDRIEPALVSTLSESPLEFNDLETARTRFLIWNSNWSYKTATIN